MSSDFMSFVGDNPYDMDSESGKKRYCQNAKKALLSPETPSYAKPYLKSGISLYER